LTRFISLSEFFWLAEQVTGIEAEVLANPGSINLADSALHAPQASFAEQDFYPDLIDKAAVLTCHLAWNHPLPDGNKRVSWACLVTFLDLNGVVWDPDPPDVDDAEEAVLSVAAHVVDEVWLASWLRERTRPAKD
jgi:death-on-curing protein